MGYMKSNQHIRKSLASRTMNFELCKFLLAFDWFKNKQLLSQLTHAYYRDTVPLSRKIFLPTLVSLPLHHVSSTWTFPPNQYMSHILKLSWMISSAINLMYLIDNIMPKILKLSAPALAVHPTKLHNLCINTSSTSMWPAEWKLSHVTPVFKKDDGTSLSNYRPISVLSIKPKILERVSFDQLYDVFQPPFSSNMSRFLGGHSYCTALVKIVNDWRLAVDFRKVTGFIAMDLSRAFDSICLLAKLHGYGVDEGGN